MPPVCVKCQRFMKPERNGVAVEEMASFGPYKLWHADLWKCPECGAEFITGFANLPMVEHFEPTYGKVRFREPLVYRAFWTEKDKPLEEAP